MSAAKYIDIIHRYDRSDNIARAPGPNIPGKAVRKEKELAKWLFKMLLSDRILDDAFLVKVFLPKIDEYAAEVEKNSRAYIAAIETV